MHNKNASNNGTYRKGELEICLQTAMVLTKVITCNITNKSCELQQEGAELCQAQPAKHKLFGFNVAIFWFGLLMVVLLNC